MALKILFLSHKFFPDIGGIEVNSGILADFFSKSGAEVHLLTWSESREPDSQVHSYKVIRNPRVDKVFKEHIWADVVFENNPSLKLSWPAVLLRKPHVIAIHTWIRRPGGGMGFREWLKMRWLGLADTVISVSAKLKEGTHPDAVVIENSYNDFLFRKLDSVKREKDFVFLGRLVSDKGADMAVNLIRRLNDKLEKNDVKYSLTIIGEGPERERLQDLVKAQELVEAVQFTGSLTGEKLVNCLNQHKYILVPSKWEEPFGMVALEGMATGCLPIVSNGGGLPEAVGKAGIIFERNSLNSLFENVKALTEDPDLEQHIRGNFEGHLVNHTAELVSGRYFEIIKSVENANRPR